SEGAEDDQLMPLAAGLNELQPWVDQWHSEVNPDYGVSMAEFTREQLHELTLRLGVTTDDLAAWRPPAPTRGRRRKRATSSKNPSTPPPPREIRPKCY